MTQKKWRSENELIRSNQNMRPEVTCVVVLPLRKQSLEEMVKAIENTKNFKEP